MNKQLSIIIVTYNSERLIFDCLDSIYQYNDIGDELEVIVVDNCSVNVDALFSKIKLNYQDKVVLIKNRVNGGYGHGNNQGAKVATSSRLVVMNPDVRLVSPIFRSIIDTFNSNKNIGMMGVRFVDGSNPLYFKPEYSTLFRLVFGRQLLKYGCYKIEQVFFSGSFLVFDKTSFIKAGLFDENIFMYHEEADISNRLLAIGKETLMAENLIVLHLAHGRTVNYKLLKIGSESRNYYFKKYKANIDKYYKNLLFIYNVKYWIAVLINNKLKKEEFKAWIIMCKNKGEI
jgi:GT2 family glycosyltransferase